MKLAMLSWQVFSNSSLDQSVKSLSRSWQSSGLWNRWLWTRGQMHRNESLRKVAAVKMTDLKTVLVSSRLGQSTCIACSKILEWTQEWRTLLTRPSKLCRSLGSKFFKIKMSLTWQFSPNSMESCFALCFRNNLRVTSRAMDNSW